MATLNQANAQSIFATGGLLRMVQSARLRFAQYRVYRETLNELNALSARDLADLGLNRSLVKRTAYEAAYGN